MKSWNFSSNGETFEHLIDHHREPHRHYHTDQHISACLKHLDEIQDQLEKPHEVELALWFHDAIYQPFSSTNEEDSAKWAAKFLEQNNANKNIIDRVENLILITKHDGKPHGNDEEILVDIDLSILGAPTHIYDQFEENVQKEYEKVPKFIFRRERRKILRGFLKKERLYNHPHFFEKLETQAKANLKRAIAAL